MLYPFTYKPMLSRYIQFSHSHVKHKSFTATNNCQHSTIWNRSLHSNSIQYHSMPYDKTLGSTPSLYTYSHVKYKPYNLTHSCRYSMQYSSTQYRSISFYNKLKHRSQSIRGYLLDENHQSYIKQRITRYKDYIPFIRTPLIFIKPRPAETKLPIKQQLISTLIECTVFTVSYGSSIVLPYIIQLSSHHTYLVQPLILITTYCSIIYFLPKLPEPPSGRSGAWYAVLRYFRSLVLVTLFFILWNIPIVYSVKLWLGILWSDVNSLTRLMNNHDTDILNYIIIQPIIEEMVYRGLLFARLCRIIGTIPACLISSSIYATVYSINYNTLSFDYKRYNDVYWFSIVFSLSYRLSGRLWLPCILRCGSSFLVWTQCESISPLNTDITERNDMLCEVLYWLQNNHITPLHDIQTVLNTQPNIDKHTVQHVIDVVYSILDRSNKGYLTADEFTYLFTLQHNIPYILAAAKQIIQSNAQQIITSNTQYNNNNYSTIYPNNNYIQLNDKQINSLKELYAEVNKLESQYNPVADQVRDITELIETISDTNDSLCVDNTNNILTEQQLQLYYSYYNELCHSLVNSRVLSSISSYRSNHNNTVNKQLFTDYMLQRYLLDQGNFYELVNRLIDIQLYNTPHPLDIVLNGSIKWE